MIKAVRGTRDLLPPETALWNFVEEKVREVFRAYNFQEIRTPIFESTELFARGVGEDTDVVSKEMFTWEDPQQRYLKMRESYLEAVNALREGRLPSWETTLDVLAGTQSSPPLPDRTALL